MKAKISAVIITKNEEKNISDCLEGLNWVDEIIVVDDFSSDRTKEICLKFDNVKFYENKFKDFASQRNYGLGLAKNKWVLSTDPDEEIPPELKDEMVNAVDKGNGAYAYSMPTKNIFYGKWLRYGGWYPDYHIRFFLKDKAGWDNLVHEGVKVKGVSSYFKNAIIHYGHKTIDETISKLNKYTSIESNAKFSEGKSTSGFKMIYGAVYEFFNRHIIKQGWRDGVCGFIANAYMFVYKFTTEAKLMILNISKKKQK
ncbi:MAG: glycosyltransferase family 2 protein [Armatimonadota bacterium]